MKRLLPFVFLIASLSVFSQQIPSYYNDVNMNQAGTALKDALAVKIIGSHTSILTYTPGVWNALKQTDIDPTDNTRVVLIYGWNDTDSDITNDRTRGKDNHGGGSGVWNREHVYSKSLANPNLGTTGPGADAHNLRPCDAQRNSSRSNRKFASGSGNSGATAQGNWYPGDEWKGDVARMMMYMYLRYGNQSLPTGVGVGNTVATDPNMIDLFLQWNAEDPVSDLEKQRNPVLEQLQGNRNPFVDNPAFATQIWGGPQAEDLFGNGGGNTDTQAPTAPSGLVASNITQTTVDLAWTAATDNTAVTGYNIYNGSTQVATTTNTNTTVSNLTAGTSYNFTVKAFDAAANVSIASNAVSVTTTSGGSGGNGTATELLFSEYVEGSSYNKAIEIANFTGATVDLSGYSIKKATNGGGSWSNTLTLTGQLDNGKVYVIAHNSASTTIKNKAQLTNSSVMNFNGNDAIALFKGSTLIDLIGDQNSSANFGKDQTFQRKSSITSPNTTYTVAEWDILAKDTFSGLGDHSIDGGSTADTTAPTAPSSLVTSNLTQTTVNLAWTAATDNVGVTGYEVYQNDTKVATVTTVSYAVTGLTADTAYNYSIKAIDAAGNISALSNKVFITTLPTPDTTAPSAPSSLAVSNVTQTTVDLAWTASTDNIGVTGYDIYNGSTKIATVTTTSYSVTGLTAATNYTFSVKAKDAAGNISTASNVVGVTTKSNVDATAPTAPSSLVASNVTQTSVNLAWTASTDNVGVTGYDIYNGSTKITTVTSTNYTVTSLTAATNYTFSVKAKDAAGNISTASNVVGVTTQASTITYCDSKGNNVNYEYIDNVAIGGISNVTSANGGYGDFTSQTGNISIGNNTIVLSAGFASSSYTEYWKVWIDFNRNGTFETSEEVVTGSSSSAGNLSYNFTVPSSVTTGTTRMRVSMKWNAAPTACETISYGEVEDYTVNISSSSKVMTTVHIDGELGNEEPIFNAKVYPNPSVDYIVLKLADSREAFYKITNYVGQTVMQGKIDRQIDIRDLNTGMYIIEVNDNQRSFTKKFMKK
ncbi:endonuclease [uncultured Tenacibaculum sp.]|uniref:fibronectin type III domain-containing protein n=1 Tax=uncultured Tenacibaculum sp. TaxID=174713 RepID=UPI0026399D30|nr:endonuclease [uncultured Tenacibaculum sp.]